VTRRDGVAVPMVLAPGALPLAAGLALVPLVGGGAPGAVLGMGALALALYVAALAVPWAPALPWALGLLALEYVTWLALRGAPLDATAPVYAAAFFLCAELGWLGLEARSGGRPWLGRAVAVGLVTLAGTALGAALLLMAALPVAGGPPLTGLGVAAAIAVTAALAWLGRR